jgi:hypothetical protein
MIRFTHDQQCAAGLDRAGEMDLLKLAIRKIDLPEGGCERETPDQIVLARFQFVVSLMTAMFAGQSPAAGSSASLPMP